MTEPRRAPIGGGPRMRALVRRVANPVVLRLRLAGGRRSVWGVITVTGRVSGQPRSNPVLPHITGDRVVIPLSYGEDVQWVQNVLAAGHARLRYRGAVLMLSGPRMADLDEAADLLPPKLVGQYRRLRFDRMMVLEGATASP